MIRVAVIDYGMGNIDSVVRALEICGATPSVTSQEEEIAQAAAVVLPGVGSFSDGMNQLRNKGLVEILDRQVLDKGVPFLGICLGMQLLATRGTEGGETPGLGWIPGTVRRLSPEGEGERIPHVGWNEVRFQGSEPLFTGIASGCDFYFTHSYHFIPESPAHVTARTPYCGHLVAAVRRGSIQGVQFHPEKSQKAGMRLLQNFLRT